MPSFSSFIYSSLCWCFLIWMTLKVLLQRFLNQVLESENFRATLIGSRHQISAHRLNPDFQFDLPAQNDLLKRFLLTEINKAKAGLSGFSEAIKLPTAKNQEEEMVLKELDKLWKEAQKQQFYGGCGGFS